jgi:hypothetical protein
LQSEKGSIKTITKLSIVTTAFFFACMINQAFAKRISMNEKQVAVTSDLPPVAAMTLIPGAIACLWENISGNAGLLGDKMPGREA